MSVAGNLTAFRASLLNGGMRPNQFEVELHFPALVGGNATASLLGRFHCQAASLPASTFAPIDVFYQGRSIKVAGEREFAPWTIRVINENFVIRDAMVKWSNAINNIKENSGVIQPLLYQTDLTVRQLDRNGVSSKEITIVDAMPVSVGEIGLAWDANNQIEVFDVTFVYNYFTETGVNA